MINYDYYLTYKGPNLVKVTFNDNDITDSIKPTDSFLSCIKNLLRYKINGGWEIQDLNYLHVSISIIFLPFPLNC